MLIKLRLFTSCRRKGELWLLEAKPGLFAMLEDGDGNSFIPVWASEEEAKSNISDDWCDYAVTTMGVDEFVDWLNELGNDGIGIALSSSISDSALPFPAYIMKKCLRVLQRRVIKTWWERSFMMKNGQMVLMNLMSWKMRNEAILTFVLTKFLLFM